MSEQENENKYELTNETKKVNGYYLSRIKALKDIKRFEVRKGDLGGYIFKEDNLSQKGDCWVGEEAIVMHNARVEDNAFVNEDAYVGGDTIVKDFAIVKGEAKVYGKSIIKNNAVVQDRAIVIGATIEDKSKVIQSATIREGVTLSEDVVIGKGIDIKGDIQLFGIDYF